VHSLGAGLAFKPLASFYWVFAESQGFAGFFSTLAGIGKADVGVHSERQCAVFAVVSVVKTPVFVALRHDQKIESALIGQFVLFFYWF
jgi:hypothetical protein